MVAGGWGEGRVVGGSTLTVMVVKHIYTWGQIS